MCPANHYCPLGTTQPAPCPSGTTSAVGASACTPPVHTVMLFEVIVLILWALFFVLAMWVCVYVKVRARTTRAVASVIRLRLER